MASVEYSEMPKVCRLCTTNGDRPIDLLNSTGICITNPPGWVPGISQLKGGGIRISSQSLDDEHLVAGGYGPVSEAFPASVVGNQASDRIQELMNRLWDAEQFWIDNWQRGAVYLMVQLTEDSGLRYSRIKTGAFSLGTYAYGARAGFPNNTLVLEREPAWQPVPPGEMIGPFRNLVKNPSFERWKRYGIADTFPSGWWIEEGESFPANPICEVEENQARDEKYALKMSFVGAGGQAPNEWYIWQRVRLIPDQDYTFKVWLNLTMGGGAGEEFFIRLTNETGAVTYLSETYTVSQYGWQYVTFTMDRGWYYQVLEIGFTAPATSVGSTAIVDHIILTEGTWDSASWPGGDDGFYLGSTVIYSYTDPANYDYDRARAWPIDPTNYIDVLNVPGDMDADLRFALEFQQMEQMDEYYSSGQYLAKATAIFMEKNAPWEHLLQYDVMGDETVSGVGRGQAKIALPVDTPKIIHTQQFNGDEVTKLINHMFRVFIKGYNNGDVWYWVSYWIGDPANEVVLSRKLELDTAATIQSELYAITPVEPVNWTRVSAEQFPASLGFTIYAMTAEEEEDWILLDAVFLIPADNGGAWCEEIIATGQALTLDSTSLAKPVQKAYNITPAAQDYPNNRSGGGQPPSHAVEYRGKLYVFYNIGGTVSDEWVFDGSIWDATMTYAAGPVTDSTIFNNRLYMSTYDGDVYYYDHNTDTSTLVIAYGAVVCRAIQAYANDLYTAYDQWIVSTIGAMPDKNTTANVSCLALYKHQLWAGCVNGDTYYLDAWPPTGGNPTWKDGPAVGDVNDMQEFHDRLYILCESGEVYEWDGQAATLVRASDAARDDKARELEVYNDELFLLTGGTAQNTMSLWKMDNDDSTIWTEVFGFDSEDSYEDYAVMATYAGRLCCVVSPDTTSVWACIWHAPLIATLSIPDHSGSAMTLVPQARNRIHCLFEENVNGFLVSETTAIGANAAKVWILPHWRAIRSD